MDERSLSNCAFWIEGAFLVVGYFELFRIKILGSRVFRLLFAFLGRPSSKLFQLKLLRCSFFDAPLERRAFSPTFLFS